MHYRVILTFIALQVAILGTLLGLMHKAKAADLNRYKAPLAMAAPVLGWNWSGVYTGVEGGADWAGFSLDAPLGIGGSTSPSSYIVGVDGAVMHQSVGSPWVFAALVNLDYTHPSIGGSGVPTWRGMGQGGVGLGFGDWLFLAKGGIVGDRTSGLKVLGTPFASGNFGWTAGAELDWHFAGQFVWKVLDYQFVDKNGLAIGPISINQTDHEIKTGLTYRWN